ncbi:hypothetical protein [Actinophytocola gossypii]|uniref:Secreted protein n=1 Tax=Actinophytocola gossypii TaxID=2812003 RepID=A0ABT2JBH3_9PSEU|nr:hypothetical protein [Actinophytocola gossypii]MCT2585200.1 hypothetical protein [Actinophytocola gossypii]
MPTTVVIVVLVVIGVAALVTVPLMIRSTRRQVVEDVPADGPRPALDSPARVWTERGERVVRELGDTLGEHADPLGISTDAAHVVAELRLTASRVAELDHALARIPVPSLEEELRTLGVALAEAEASGRPAATDLARSHEAVTARLAAAARGRDAREALLARMRATVTELELARDELTELVADLGGTSRADHVEDTAAGRLAGRLDALREGLVQVRDMSDPEIGSGSQG